MSVTPENLMVVVNASKWPHDFAQHHMYCCPAAEGGFDDSAKHVPAKYVANYVQKNIQYIAVVAACVRLNAEGEDEVLWKFDEISDEEAIARANEVRKSTQRFQKPCLVFLESQLSRTDIVYDRNGGFMGTRMYADVTTLEPTDVKDLATKLRKVPWSQLPKLPVK